MAFNFSTFGSAVTKGLNESIGVLPEKIIYGADTLKKGAGKGTLGKWTSEVYGGTFKDIMDTMQGKSDDGSDDPAIKDPTLRASQIDPEGELGALQDIRKKKQGRAAANLSPASGASILTGPR